MLKIVRNDLVRMECDAIVNTANSEPVYSTGVDTAVYEAAGAEELLAERRKIGHVDEGEVFVTDAYRLPVKKIIHAVSPKYRDGKSGEEDKLRACYKKSLKLARELGMTSIAFPVISTGSFGYPVEEGMGIAVEEINKFLKWHELTVYLVVFDERTTIESRKYIPELEAFIESNYIENKLNREYGFKGQFLRSEVMPAPSNVCKREALFDSEAHLADLIVECCQEQTEETDKICEEATYSSARFKFDPDDDASFYELENKLNNRLAHIKDSFSDYLMYLIESRGMTSQEVYTRSVVSKKLFSKIKTNPNYHPSKEVALRLCIGARLNIDDSKDLLSRAGYTFSPCELYDLIFEFFIENEIYDIVEISVQLDEHGLENFIES